MKRALTIALVAVVAAISYACGGGGDDAQPDQPTPAVDCPKKPEQCK